MAVFVMIIMNIDIQKYNQKWEQEICKVILTKYFSVVDQFYFFLCFNK